VNPFHESGSRYEMPDFQTNLCVAQNS